MLRAITIIVVAMSNVLTLSAANAKAPPNGAVGRVIFSGCSTPFALTNWYGTLAKQNPVHVHQITDQEIQEGSQMWRYEDGRLFFGNSQFALTNWYGKMKKGNEVSLHMRTDQEDLEGSQIWHFGEDGRIYFGSTFGFALTNWYGKCVNSKNQLSIHEVTDQETAERSQFWEFVPVLNAKMISDSQRGWKPFDGSSETAKPGEAKGDCTGAAHPVQSLALKRRVTIDECIDWLEQDCQGPPGFAEHGQPKCQTQFGAATGLAISVGFPNEPSGQCRAWFTRVPNGQNPVSQWDCFVRDYANEEL